MLHIRSITVGVAGSPYYTNLYFLGGMSDRNAALTRVRNFWVALQGVIPTTMSTSVESEVRDIDPATGNVLDIQAGAEQAAVVGNGSGSVAPPATQGLIRLSTGSVRLNRQVRGRIFIPGVLQTALTAQGRPSSIYQTTLTNAGEGLRGISNGVSLCVWSRPRTLTGPVGLPGATATVTSASAWGEFAVLRSRRD